LILFQITYVLGFDQNNFLPFIGETESIKEENTFFGKGEVVTFLFLSEEGDGDDIDN